MKEQLITFETAKLAKEMGFQSYTSFYYSEDGEIKGTKMGMHGNPNAYGGISAPTQSLLQKWLREVHEINLFMSTWGYNNEFYHVEDIIKGLGFSSTIIGNGGKGSTNYEEALEQGLVVALKLI